MDEFHRLGKNFNNEFSSVINKNHANGLNKFLRKNGCWWMNFIFYECFINDDEWTSSTMNGNQINAKAAIFLREVEYNSFGEVGLQLPTKWETRKWS